MSIGEAVANATQYLTDHPEEARYRDAAAIARVDGGLRVTVEGPDGATLRTDMPTAIGGSAGEPSPGWFLRAAIASCVASLVVIRAAMLEFEPDGVEVTVDSESDDRGILGLDDAIPAGPLSTAIRVAISARGRPSAEIDAIARWAIDHCPVSDAIKRAVPLEIVIDHTSD
jgi:uncharacterized OsmC-like protein